METNPAEQILAEQKVDGVEPAGNPAQNVPELDPSAFDPSPDEERSAKSFLYRFRGWILGVAAVVLLIIPPADLALVPFLIFVNLLILAVYMRVKARRAIGDHARGKVRVAEKLITWGAYARLRHPLYVSNMAIAVGCVFLHLGLHWLVLPFLAGILVFEWRLSVQEDHFLEDKFGDEWRVWAMHTPAFFPREYHLSGPMRSAKAAIISDVSTWFWLAIAIGLILFRKIDFLLWA